MLDSVASHRFLPEQIMDGVVRANHLYPSVEVGVTGIVGAKAVGMILDGQLLWEDFVAMDTSAQQKEMYLSSGFWAHSNADASPPSWVDGDAELLSKFAMTWRRRSLVLCARYAGAVLPGEVPDVSGLSVAKLDGRPTEDELVASETLFAQQNGLSVFRPEAVALSSMWNVVSGLLQDRDARRLARVYRPRLSAASNGTGGDNMRKEAMTAEKAQFRSLLRPLVGNTLGDRLPAIMSEAGIGLSRSVVGIMVETLLPAS